MTKDDVRLAAPSTPNAAGSPPHGVLSKVPQVTAFFWIIKVLCTTVGETASDFLNVNLGLGLKGTAVAAGMVLLLALVFQFRAKRYVPGIYWLTVVLVSVFGTLVTDILTDSLGFPLEASNVIFGVALALTFAAWYAKEGTLSIHSIFTVRREVFYWSAILFTFALGTASGDLMAEKLGLGYLVTGLIVLGVIAATVIAWRLGLDAVLGFWIVYILTRPLGASIGDFLSQSRENGGLGLGATVTSAVFLAAILAVVVYLATTQRDSVAVVPERMAPERRGPAAVWQVVGVAVVLLGASGAGYAARRTQLANHAAASVSLAAPLGDLSHFRLFAGDMLSAEKAGNASAAKSRADDLETAWDNAQASMRPMNPQKWTLMDSAIDDVLKKVRAGNGGERDSLEAFTQVMDTLADQTPPSGTRAPTSSPSAERPKALAGAKPLGDLSAFRSIAEDMLRLERVADASHVKSRASDLETAWDQNQSRLKPLSPEKWTLMDGAIDDVLKKVRAPQQNPAASVASLEALIAVVDTLDHHGT
ncbi:MAG: hypothetical protein ABI488_06110 [Polyangiaceae bacterium]